MLRKNFPHRKNERRVGALDRLKANLKAHKAKLSTLDADAAANLSAKIDRLTAEQAILEKRIA